MDGVAAKVPEEVAVLFQHDDFDAGTREQKPSTMLAGRRRRCNSGSRAWRSSAIACGDLRRRACSRPVFKTRSVAAGYCRSFAAGRRGRRTSSPPQFGHMPLSTPSAQPTQNVHSNEQMRASVEEGGRSLSQHSQPGRNASMVKVLMVAG
jgi:hypothetical protein